MKFLKIMFATVLVFGSLHFSFLNVTAAESSEADNSDEESKQTTQESEEVTESESTEDVHTSKEEVESAEDGITEEVSQEETADEDVEEIEEVEQVEESEEVESNIDSSEEVDSKPEISSFSAKVATLPYKEGEHHDALIEIKKKLNAIGFNGIIETNYFGSYTTTKVLQFQKYYGLNQTGIINQVTLDKLNEVYNSPFQLGKRHESTIELKEKLNSLGYGDIIVTNLYGSWTVNRVKKFQSENGLQVNGIADQKTWKKLNELASKTEFKVGDRHPNIISIKQKLNAIGFGKITVTTYFGSWTRTKLMQFQEYYGLSQTGTTNKATLDKLDEVYNSPFKLGKRHVETVELKEKLNSLGYGNIIVTNLYGSWTVKRVKKFQSENGLHVNGIADEPTWLKLNQLLAKIDFKVGDRHPNIVSIKQKLNAIGFGKITVTNYYGSYTGTKVRQFQEYYGLTKTGATNAATVEKLNEIYYSDFQLGESHESIAELKVKLNTIGYGTILVSDLYGSFTEKRVKKFQRDNGLIDHGIVDNKTAAKLNSEFNRSEFKQGDRHHYILAYKEKLNRVGFGKIKVTDYFGSWTTTKIKQFQKIYGLTQNGQLNKATIAKLDEIYNSPYQVGKSHPDLIGIKKMLNTLGYGDIHVTEYYGSWTDNRVRKFQRDHNLVENGIIDQVTLKKINDLIEVIEEFDISLEEALKMQMSVNPQTDKYRNDPAYISSNHVKLGQKGLSGAGYNLNLRVEPSTASDVHVTVGPNTTMVILGTVKGANYDGSTNWYKVWYKGEESYAHQSLVIEQDTQMAIVIPDSLNVRADANANSHRYGTVSKDTVLEVVDYKGSWLEVPYSAWRSAREVDTLDYLDPTKNDEFQHLDLSSRVGATAAELNSFLVGKGILEGTGQAFVDAAKMHNINELYLVSHAVLETGNGKSELANGIIVNDKKVYNMFGIGAIDACPKKCGSERAFKEEWDSPYEAIVGGAKFIGQKYIHNGFNQNTIYKMRWNPLGMIGEKGKAQHQYATDVAWATKQVSNLKKLHEDVLDNPLLKFNIVQYKK